MAGIKSTRRERIKKGIRKHLAGSTERPRLTVFRSNKGLELWVTNDDNRVPIKVKANLRVGTIVADLTTFRGLTNPFKIVIND